MPATVSLGALWGHRSAIIAGPSVLNALRRARLRSRTRGRVFGWIRWSPLVPWLELAQPDCVPVFPRPELPHGTRLRTQECPGKTEKDPS